MPKIPKADFAITIDFERGIGSPSRVFRAMSDLIDALQETDKSLIGSINSNIQPVLLLEDVETGSVKAWLRQAVKSVDDEGLKKLDWKQIVGKYLVDAKVLIVNFLEDKTDIMNADEIEEIVNEIYALAESTQVNNIPAYEPIPREKLLGSIEKINNALAPLNDSDRATFTTSDREVNFNLSLYISPETIEDLVTAESLETITKMILKFKKPDFLGSSQWEFKYDKRTITANILDNAWLQKFREGKILIKPGDAIKADVFTEVKYGYDREVVSTHYRITKVDEIINFTPSHQDGLFDNNSPKN